MSYDKKVIKLCELLEDYHIKNSEIFQLIFTLQDMYKDQCDLTEQYRTDVLILEGKITKAIESLG